MTTLFPIGDAYVTIDRETGGVLEEGFHAAPFIQRERNPIPRTAFLDDRFADISGVIWSRIGIGNLSRQVRPITYVHNPLAQTPLPLNWGVWDREFVTTRRGECHLALPNPDANFVTDLQTGKAPPNASPRRYGASSNATIRNSTM